MLKVFRFKFIMEKYKLKNKKSSRRRRGQWYVIKFLELGSNMGSFDCSTDQTASGYINAPKNPTKLQY